MCGVWEVVPEMVPQMCVVCVYVWVSGVVWCVYVPEMVPQMTHTAACSQEASNDFDTPSMWNVEGRNVWAITWHGRA